MAHRYPHQNFPAVSGSAWRWPGRWPSSRKCCCSTSRSGRSTPRSARNFGNGSGGCTTEIHLTSVFVTHDQDEALELADRVLVMNEGRIEQIGTPDDVLSQSGDGIRREISRAGQFLPRALGRRQSPFRHAGARLAGICRRADAGGPCLIRPHELDLSVERAGRRPFRPSSRGFHSARPDARNRSPGVVGRAALRQRDDAKIAIVR